MNRRFPYLRGRSGVRGSSGGSPLLTLPAGAMLDIDPANGVTLTAGRITTLVDQAGSVSFGVITNGPTFVAAHAPFSGKPSMLLDPTGVVEGLQATVTNAATSWTIYSVQNSVSGANDQRVIDTNAGRIILWQENAGVVAHFDGATRSYGASTTGAQCLTLRLENGVGGEAWRGTASPTSLGTASYTTRSFGGNCAVGNASGGPSTSRMFDGHIGRILVYPSAHDAAERAAVWAYLNQEYGV